MNRTTEGIPIISEYTARQAVEDGMLVALSGPLYPDHGDAWIPKMVKEAGIKLPVLMTSGAFDDCVSPLDDNHQLAPCQDIEGRLWDVLHLTAWAMRRNPEGHRASFNIKYFPNVSKGSDHHPRAITRRLIAALSVDEDGPYLTILRPEDD